MWSSMPAKVNEQRGGASLRLRASDESRRVFNTLQPVRVVMSETRNCKDLLLTRRQQQLFRVFDDEWPLDVTHCMNTTVFYLASCVKELSSNFSQSIVTPSFRRNVETGMSTVEQTMFLRRVFRHCQRLWPRIWMDAGANQHHKTIGELHGSRISSHQLPLAKCVRSVRNKIAEQNDALRQTGQLVGWLIPQIRSTAINRKL